MEKEILEKQLEELRERKQMIDNRMAANEDWDRLIQRSTEIKSWDLFIVNGFADEKCFFLPIRDEVLVVYDEKFISPEEWVSIKEKHIHFLEDILVSDVYMRLHRLSIIDDRKWRLDRKEQQLVDRVDYHRKEVEVLQREIDNIHLEKENVE